MPVENSKKKFRELSNQVQTGEKQNSEGLPAGWKWVKLGEVCEVITGTTPPKADPNNYGNDIPFFKPPHLWDTLISETKEQLSLKGAENARIVPPNTVLVTCIGNLGRTGFVKKRAAFNQQINAIVENESIDGKYIFYQAQSPLFKKQLDRLATGTTVSIVNKGNFETIEIPLPPKDDQHAIVSKIEELLSELDKGKQQLETAQQQLKIYRQAVLKWAFEGKLTNKDVKEGELPEGWKFDKIKNVCLNIKVGIVVKPTNFYSKNNRGIRAFRSANVREFRVNDQDWVYFSEDANELNKRTQVNAGDVLLVRSGYPGTSCVVPKSYGGCNAIDILIATPDKSKILPNFLCSFNNSPLGKGHFVSKSRGVAQKHLNVGEYSNLSIAYPSTEEQQRIIQVLESKLTICDKVEETITICLQQAETLRQSILKKAFEGKLISNFRINENQ